MRGGEQVSPLSEIFEMVQMNREAAKFSREGGARGGVRTIEAQKSEVPIPKGFIGVPTDSDLFPKTVVKKMQDVLPPDMAIPEGKGFRPVKKPGYMPLPGTGVGEDVVTLPSGARVLDWNVPRPKVEYEEGETYQYQPDEMSLDVLDPSGRRREGWDDEGDLEVARRMYLDRLEEHVQQLSEASETFNQRTKSWIESTEDRPSVANLLAQNFWVNFDNVIAGGDQSVVEGPRGEQYLYGDVEGEGGRNLLAAIDHRLNRINQIKSGIDAREIAAEREGVQAEVLEAHLDAKAALTPELWDSNPGQYWKLLSMIYGVGAGSSVDTPALMIINPLNIDYPAELRRALEDVWVNAQRSNANIPETMDEWIEKTAKRAYSRGVDVNDFLRMRFPLIDVSPEAIERAANRKKQVRDPSTFYGYMSPRTDFDVAAPLAQMKEIRDYSGEEALLAAIRERLLRMMEIKQASGLEGATFQEVMEKSPDLVTEMDRALHDFLSALMDLYGSMRFVTRDNTMNQSYDIDHATKMEIFVKGLYLAQAWQLFLHKWVPQFQEGEGVPAEEIGLATDLDVISAINGEFVRVAAIADDMGLHDVADAVDGMFS